MGVSGVPRLGSPPPAPQPSKTRAVRKTPYVIRGTAPAERLLDELPILGPAAQLVPVGQLQLA